MPIFIKLVHLRFQEAVQRDLLPQFIFRLPGPHLFHRSIREMKVHFTAENKDSERISPTTLNSNPNPVACSSLYEPKSVLDLRGSPSPLTDENPTSKTASDNMLEAVCVDDALQLEGSDRSLISQHLEDWDSLMKELGLHDDLIPVSKPIVSQFSSDNDLMAEIQFSNVPDLSPVSSFNSMHFLPAGFGIHSCIPTAYAAAAPLHQTTGDPNGCNWNVGFDCVDELIRLAECFETNSYQLGNVLLARLNQRLRVPMGKPLQRAAFYFKEALQSLLTGSTRSARVAGSSEIIQTIKAQKTFSIISPISMFSSFTANQAILDALDGSVQVHAIDFDIGFGDHWATFMKELADKADSCKAAQPSLRISALVPEEFTVESKLVRENLSQFADELNMRFEIDFVLIRTFEYLLFNSIKFMDGERVAVMLSPAMLLHNGTRFLNDLRRVSPHVVVHVNVHMAGVFGSSSYRQTTIDGLEFYSTILESLEAADYNGGGDWMRRIETFVLFPKILDSVEAVGQRLTPLKEAMATAGMGQVGMSQFAEFQAECLLRRFQVQGFNVVKRQAEMLLCWHDRPLVATSAWRHCIIMGE